MAQRQLQRGGVGHAADRRHPGRSPWDQEVAAAVLSLDSAWRDFDRLQGQLLHDGGRPRPGRTGRRIADRRRHHRAGALVQGQGTQLRLRHQPDHRAHGFDRRRQFADLGQVRLLPQRSGLSAELASSTGAGGGRRFYRRDRRRGVLGAGELRRRPLPPRQVGRTRQAQLPRGTQVQSLRTGT